MYISKNPKPARFLSLSWPKNRELNGASEFVRDFILDYCEAQAKKSPDGIYWI